MHKHLPDREVKKILDSSQTIAVVGLSVKASRPSNRVARYLLDAGYRVIPVNPGQRSILGLACFPDLTSIPEPVDIVDIFRKSQDIPPIVEQALEIRALVVWMQQGISNEPAAERCREKGVTCIMDSCIKIEHARLLV